MKMMKMFKTTINPEMYYRLIYLKVHLYLNLFKILLLNQEEVLKIMLILFINLPSKLLYFD